MIQPSIEGERRMLEARPERSGLVQTHVRPLCDRANGSYSPERGLRLYRLLGIRASELGRRNDRPTTLKWAAKFMLTRMSRIGTPAGITKKRMP
jgi:hypothetical protein